MGSHYPRWYLFEGKGVNCPLWYLFEGMGVIVLRGTCLRGQESLSSAVLAESAWPLFLLASLHLPFPGPCCCEGTRLVSVSCPRSLVSGQILSTK